MTRETGAARPIRYEFVESAILFHSLISIDDTTCYIVTDNLLLVVNLSHFIANVSRFECQSSECSIPCRTFLPCGVLHDCL
jgi:hypothetical protein